ncbi:hypothetical protein [Escherichia coli]|uniref:hypothetical protein n=1 Tax=Escherichia coli TaxID=562 RepID=UPI0010AD19B9|nr:hypothetical protein [Escherichia coli]TIZ31368.1 hypothetical protein C9342_22115 [Escherichia coli]
MKGKFSLLQVKRGKIKYRKGMNGLGLAWLGSILIFPAKYDKIFYKSETLLITIYPRIHNLLIPAQEEINHQ